MLDRCPHCGGKLEAAEAPRHNLSPREVTIAFRAAKGYSIPEIAADLGLSRHTVADRMRQIYVKLAVSSRAELALEVRRLGLI